jgi:hypothetical protein
MVFMLGQRAINPVNPGVMKIKTRLVFKLIDVVTSDESGCQGCKFLALPVDGTLEVYNILCSDDLQLTWDGFRFVLVVLYNNAKR